MSKIKASTNSLVEALLFSEAPDEGKPHDSLHQTNTGYSIISFSV
jgi:hypothetical protein